MGVVIFPCFVFVVGLGFLMLCGFLLFWCLSQKLATVKKPTLDSDQKLYRDFLDGFS